MLQKINTQWFFCGLFCFLMGPKTDPGGTPLTHLGTDVFKGGRAHERKADEEHILAGGAETLMVRV